MTNWPFVWFNIFVYLCAYASAQISGQEEIPMKHNAKKILSLVLASVMMLSLLPLTAYAGEATEKEQATGETAVEKSSAQDTRGGY